MLNKESNLILNFAEYDQLLKKLIVFKNAR